MISPGMGLGGFSSARSNIGHGARHEGKEEAWKWSNKPGSQKSDRGRLRELVLSPIDHSPYSRFDGFLIDARSHCDVLDGYAQRFEHRHVLGMSPPCVAAHNHLAEFVNV